MTKEKRTFELCGGMQLPKQARNNVTELVFILDRSGSMSGLESRRCMTVSPRRYIVDAFADAVSVRLV